MTCCQAAESSGDEIDDNDSSLLSNIGAAAYEVLRTKNNHQWKKCWNVSSGKVIGEAHQTPKGTWDKGDEAQAQPGHDDWFPEKMCEIMSRTQHWLDVTSLGPPDGLFMTWFKKALVNIAATSNKPGHKKITVRLLFGNIIGMPVNCNAVITELTADIPEGSNIQIWVGAWRKGVSWNHSKIIAVDGRYLENGGHNLWDRHYLKNNPVHDISMEAEGPVAHDGHLFANQMWKFIKEEQNTTIKGKIISMLPDNLPVLLQSRVTVSEYPKGKVGTLPPKYKKARVPKNPSVEGAVPIISMGRYGALLPVERPSDNAILAVIGAAQKIIRMTLQDLGPICLPSLDRVAVPGCVWPKGYLAALGTAIYKRGVDVEIALSTPGSIPDGMSPTEALYGNGWTCADVASEIIKTIRKSHPEADDTQLRKMVEENLRVCYIKQSHTNKWGDGGTRGNHTKHFIIDDQCYYMGSQNLYVCDLAEWGLLVDDKDQTKKIMEEYWNQMWENSYDPKSVEGDCNVQEIMDGLDIERDGAPVQEATKEHLVHGHLQASLNPGHKDYTYSALQELGATYI